jgi:adenylate cyclase
MKRRALLIWIGLALTLSMVGAAAKLYRIPLVHQLDSIGYDARLRLTMPGTADDRIVILDIDEKSLKEEGRWPWSRDRLALLMDKLFDRYDVAVAGFDVVFAEKDQSSGLKILRELETNQLKDVPQFRSALERLRPKLEYDQLFARSLKGRKAVLGYYFSGNEQGGKAGVSGALPDAAFSPGTFKGRPITFVHWEGYGGILPELQEAAASAGHINPLMDADGMVRRVPMIVEYNGAYYESLALAVVRTLFDRAKLTPGYAGDPRSGYAGLEWLELQTPKGNLQIPVDSEVSTLVPYRGKRGTFRYFSIADVLHDRISPEQLKDKIVLIGTSTLALTDTRPTPVGVAFPGVEIHANMIAGILDQNIKQRPAYVLGMEVVLLLAVGIALSLWLPRLSPLKMSLAGIGTLVTMALFNLWLWQSANLDLPLAKSLVLVAGLLALNVSSGYFSESRAKQKITGLFGQYVPAEVVKEMSKNPEQVSMEGESREVTILFSDVRGFTRISEGLDPRELSKLMNEFLTPFSRVIHKHHGTIDKYMGDCIMAFWGAPLHDPDHARNAILAGLEMFKVLHELQREFKARGWPEIRMGIGINTGRVSVGNMGSEVRMTYTVMGDAVNLASRLESLTKQYRVDFLVGENTKVAVPDLAYREIDMVRVKGKEAPVTVYEPIGAPNEVDPSLLEEIKLFHHALRLYRKQDWDQAELQLYNLQRLAPKSRLYQVYADRIAHFRNNPPPADWDGVFTHETK